MTEQVQEQQQSPEYLMDRNDVLLFMVQGLEDGTIPIEVQKAVLVALNDGAAPQAASQGLVSWVVQHRLGHARHPTSYIRTTIHNQMHRLRQTFGGTE